MLVLSRKQSEQIVITFNDKIVTVTIVDIIGHKVRLGIDADASIAVHRLEVWEAIQREASRLSTGSAVHGDQPNSSWRRRADATDDEGQ